jgi:hypothetical protein
MPRYPSPVCLVILLTCLASPAGAVDSETPAEKLRKALGQVRELQIHNQPLEAAVNQLREQTGINFVLDRAAVSVGPSALLNALPQGLSSGDIRRFSAPEESLPVRSALMKMLRGHNLTHVLVGDTVLITSTEKAFDRQLEQAVSVHVQAKPLTAVLEQLGRETGANLLLDPRTAKQAATTLSLDLDEVPLETAVELLADEAGLRMVRRSNVLYVTSEARAEKLQKSRPVINAATVPGQGWQIWPDASGNLRWMPPANFGGMAGVGGGGIAGLGGGALGLAGGGGGMGGITGTPQPVPLTPPLPPAKPPAPAKKAAEQPGKPAAPGVGPDGGKKPAPPEKPAAQMVLPPSRTSRGRRRNSVQNRSAFDYCGE